MSFSRPTTLGIVSCPGGAAFASEIVAHLKVIYGKRFEKKVAYIARLYEMSQEEVRRRINFADDLTSHRVSPVGEADRFRFPYFNVPCTFTRFANGEFKACIDRSIRYKDIFIVQDIANDAPVLLNGNAEQYSLSVNDHLLNLIVTIDAVMHAGARRVSLVLPTYPYGRQHKRQGREGLTASTLGRLFEKMGVDRIITLDIHSREIEHTFEKLSLENLKASYQILKLFNVETELHKENLVVVAPDTGSVERNKFYASSLGRPLAMLYKERDYSLVSQSADKSNIKRMRLLGDVKGKTVFMGDDMLGTGGTLIASMRWLKRAGAKRCIGAVSLPLFVKEAVDKFDRAHEEGLFDYIIGTNAVYLSEEIRNREWFKVASVSNLFARAVSRIHYQSSVSTLLDNTTLIQRMLKAGKNAGREKKTPSEGAKGKERKEARVVTGEGR